MAYETNTSPFFTISKYFSRSGRKIIHISMEHVFSGGVGGYREYYRMDPRNVFGKSRMKVESIIIGSGKDFTSLERRAYFVLVNLPGRPISFFGFTEVFSVGKRYI